MIARVACIAGCLAACSDPPPLVIKYALTTSASQQCFANTATKTPALSCSEVSMVCQAVLDLRIVSASDPTKEYVKVCQKVPPNRGDLCSIAGIDLPKQTTAIPEQTLAVEVAVYSDDSIAHDSATGEPICPDGLEFSPEGLPVSTSPSPAVGGRAFYHPGDAETVVALGCTDEQSLQKKSCAGANTTQITATIEDFDTTVSVPASLADRLNVLVGEPAPVISGTTTQYVLEPSHASPLERTVAGPVPGWGAAIDLPLAASACLEVLEDVPQATPSLVCKQIAVGQQAINITGVRLSKTTLDQVLVALTKTTTFPDTGLVVGIVLDDLGNPAPNIAVTASDGSSPSYLTADRQRLMAGFTSSNGIFISTAPYQTTFTAQGTGTSQPTAFGGVVAGKVTIEVLQFTQPSLP